MFPAPSRILAQAFADRELYLLHGLATIRTAAIGFAFGCAAAVVAALLFCLSPGLELAFRGVNIALFAMPAIVVGPLLVLFFNGDWPQTILAALMVYFPAMSGDAARPPTGRSAPSPTSSRLMAAARRS